VDFRVPFRGSVAVAAGVLTPAVLAGPRFRRLFPDVYVSADVEPNLAVCSRAAAVLVGDRGVLGGFSAAELLGASCGPLVAPAEVIVPGRRRAPPGLIVRVEDVPPTERWRVQAVAVTSPVRTALDLACRGSVVEAVVAVDALAHRCLPTARGDPLRLRPPRQARGGAPAPSREAGALQCGVADGDPDPARDRPRRPARAAAAGIGRTVRLDKAYPELLLGVEYDGREHLDQRRAVRRAMIVANGTPERSTAL
jgi:AbiEi antitoxin C-terminal domain